MITVGFILIARAKINKGGCSMINFRRISIGAMVIMIFVFWAGQGLGQEKKMVLRVADSFPPTHWVVKYMVKPWMEKVTKATNGLVEFEHYPSEQLGKVKDLLALTLSGVADIAYVNPSYVPEKMPLSTVAELPGVFPQICIGTRAYWSLAKDGLIYQQELAPNGVRSLFTFSFPLWQLFTRKKFETLKDIENLKMRTAGWVVDLTIRHMKAVPVRMPAPDIYEAVSRGTVDGAIVPISSAAAYKWQDVFRFMTTDLNLGSSILNYVVSEKRWKTFPSNVQKAILDAGEEITQEFCRKMEMEEDGYIAQMLKGNVKVVRLPPADMDQLKVHAGQIAEEWAKSLDSKGKPGSQVLKAYTEAVQKFR